MSGGDLSVEGSEKFRAVALQLGQMDKRLSTALRRNVRNAAKPIADAVRNAAAAHSSSVAKSITLQVSPTARGGAKVAIMAKQSKMPESKRPLPALLEGRRGPRFRHPVFGNRGTWVDQPAHPFLDATVTPRLEGVQRAILSAVDEAAASIGNG